MRILLIEDEEAVVKEIGGLLKSRCAAEVRVARSRDGALEIIEGAEDYDLIVCDLRIPTRDGGLDVAEDHGFRVHDAARERHPGTPCIFFSGYANLENVGQRLAGGSTVDIFGTGELWPLVDVRSKDSQPEFIDRSADLAAGLRELDSLEIEIAGGHSLSAYEARPMRVYATRLNGSRVVMSPLGGLSGAKVFRVEVFDSSQSSVGLVVAKVALASTVLDEIDRFRQHVAPTIGIGGFAPLADEVLAGAGRFGAAFYSLAAGWDRDLFELVTNDPASAAVAVNRLREILTVWRRSESRSVVTIEELRSARVSNDQLAPFASDLDGIRWRDVEAFSVEMNMSVQHGDLHGRNLLVDSEGRPLIIDYGDVGLGPSVLDPVTLELSLLLHDEHPDLGDWPTSKHASSWFDLERYTADSPILDLVRVCREWATASSSRIELAAMVYAHAMRQLKYPDTDKEMAITIAGAAAEVVLASEE